jgi:amidase
LKQAGIGWMGNFDNYLAMEPGVLDLCENSLGSIAEAGANVEPVIPEMNLFDMWFCWTTLRHTRRLSMLNYYNDPATRPQLKPELIWEIEQGLSLGESDVNRANMIRRTWYVELDRLFASYDFLALPSAQLFPYSKETHWPKDINSHAMDTYHRWMEVTLYANLGGIPVVNVPVGFDNQGRPMGMQIMGKFGEDQKVL